MEDFDDSEVMGELSTVGDDDFEDVVGALMRRARGGLGPKSRAAVARKHAMQRQRRPDWMGNLTGQGISRAAEELDSLPFNCSFMTLIRPQGVGEAFPQRPFRGERLLASAILSDTAAPGVFTDASNFVVISPAIFVGAVQVGASQGDTPISAFGATAFGVRLSMPAAGQGTRIFIPYNVVVPLTATQSVNVTLTIIGRAVR
jgi:hypothetical protein